MQSAMSQARSPRSASALAISHLLPAAFREVALTRIVDKNLPHELRSNAEEVSAILPVDILLTDQTQVSLIDQRGRLQRVAHSLSIHVVVGQSMQLRLNQRH